MSHIKRHVQMYLTAGVAASQSASLIVTPFNMRMEDDSPFDTIEEVLESISGIPTEFKRTLVKITWKGNLVVKSNSPLPPQCGQLLVVGTSNDPTTEDNDSASVPVEDVVASGAPKAVKRVGNAVYITTVKNTQDSDYDHIYRISGSYQVPKKVKLNGETLCHPRKDTSLGNLYTSFNAYVASPDGGSAEELDDIYAQVESSWTIELTDESAQKV